MTGPELQIRIADAETRRLRAPASILIGRAPQCDVVLDFPGVSRSHLRLEWNGSTLRLLDTSNNGSRVNDVWIHREAVELAPPVRLELGGRRVELSTMATAHGERASRPATAAERRLLQRLLLDRLDLTRLDPAALDRPELREQVRQALDGLARERLPQLVPTEHDALVTSLTDEALGLGPLEALIAEQAVAEILVVDPATIYVERKGLLERVAAHFTDAESVRSVIERIVSPLGRHVDESSPLVDARLPDGSRVNAVIPPSFLSIKI
jgi:pilus assembly protein CpaF